MTKEKLIKSIVRTSVEQFAVGFRSRHEGEVDNPEGTINSKIHNIFISILGDDIRYYSSLVRSLDSSLGNMLEAMAINIAEHFYKVERKVEGFIKPEQIQHIARILESYKTRESVPSIDDYKDKLFSDTKKINKRHESDYYIHDNKGNHYLIELKIGGDLDNKKARIKVVEKDA